MSQCEIEQYSSGAQFKRADLHIHSFGDRDHGSYDVSDTGMTPEGIVDVAISEGLELVAITDHNVIGNVPPALKYSESKGAAEFAVIRDRGSIDTPKTKEIVCTILEVVEGRLSDAKRFMEFENK